ncbi:hypothetical protein D3C78_885400 [compost metagenome]
MVEKRTNVQKCKNLLSGMWFDTIYEYSRSHQEKRVHRDMREQMKMHWEEVLNTINERTRTI